MTIYVSNVNFDMQDSDLNTLFAPYGDVESAKLITDRTTNKSRGFGFVEMKDEVAGNDAITKLNGQIINGRKLVVNIAHPKEKRSFASTSLY